MQTITYKFTVEETNLILEALGQMPFTQVYQLIGKIQAEASEQLQTGQPGPNAGQQTTFPANMEVANHDQQ